MPKPAHVNPSSRMLATAACSLAFLLAGCFGTQIFPTLHEYRISLHNGELDSAGIAFITPSAATGQEEEKQAIAMAFADVMKNERPRMRVVTLPEALSAINRAGLADAYKRMYEDYRDTGLFKREILQKVGEVTGARYIAQLKLQRFEQKDKERFGALGFRIVETRSANLRLYFQIWDSKDGAIAWEGMQETNYAYDTITERLVTLRAVTEHTAKNLIARLP